ncbi:MAG: VOC family protein [Acidimicrobiales bacterium]
MVGNARAAAERVVEAGGSIVLPPDQYGSEVLATFLDPAGNLMGIYQQPGLAEAESA